MRAHLCLLAVVLVGCARGNTLVVVTVDGNVPDAQSLQVSAVAGGKSVTFAVPLTGAAGIPPTRSFGVDVPPSVTGSFSVTVTTAPTPVSGSTSVTLSPGSVVDAAVTLGDGATDDLGAPADLASADLSSSRTIRPLSPPSTSLSSTRRPLFRWIAPADAHATVCGDRAMTRSCVTLANRADGVSAAPTADLPIGFVFWQVTSASAGPSAVWELQIPALTLTHATSTMSTLDVDGDGIAEIAIGAYTRPFTVPTQFARAYLVHGQAMLSSSKVTSFEPATGVQDGFGAAVASGGDVDGDGFSDLVIGAPAAHGGNGELRVFAGGPNGLGPMPASAPPPTWTLSPPASDVGGTLGVSVFPAGDVDGDGYGDIIAGAPAFAVGGLANSGRAYIYYGGPNGPGARVTTLDEPLPVGPHAGSLFGQRVSGAGDVNGDGLSDVLVGAPGATGNLYLFLGSASGIANHAAATVHLVGATVTDNFGTGIAFSDVNCDGLSDVAAGAPGAIAAYVFFGDATKGLVVANPMNGVYADGVSLPNGGSTAMFGWGATGVADFNGDGCNDLAISINAGIGAVRGFRGTPNGPVDISPNSFLSNGDATGNGGQLGYSVHASDPTGSGYSAIFAGLPNHPAALPDFVFGFYGSSTGPAATPSQEFTIDAPDMPMTQNGMGAAVY